MTEHPIIFSAPMVRAILDGRKTMTRRLLKPQPQEDIGLWLAERKPARWTRGDRLWVRETWRTLQKWDDDPPRRLMADIDKIDYAADGFPRNPLWAWGRTRASLHMPRWASRITLLVTDVRVERLQDITRGDCMTEGCPFPNIAQETDPVGWFCELWTHLNGADAWERNDWVSVTKFERVP